MTKYNEQPAGLRIPSRLVADPDLERELRDRCWTSIVLGRPYADVWNDLSADLADMDLLPAQRPAPDRPSGSRGRRADAFDADVVAQEADVVAQEIVSGLFAARRAQQREFGPVTTNLSAAFATLNDYGVVARENFMCCMSCGLDAISGEVDSSAGWDGYAFYHSQDAERLVETRSTYVAFGVFLRRHLSPGEIKAMPRAARNAFADEKAEALARAVIVPTFEAHGIDVDWDGSAGSRMILHDVDYYVPLDEDGLRDECMVNG